MQLRFKSRMVSSMFFESHLIRTRVHTVGTAQITPPLPRKNAPAPFLGAGFFFAQRGRREPAGEQVQPKAQQRTATRSVAISAETNCPALWNNIVV
jgi:hypothetical protein